MKTSINFKAKSVLTLPPPLPLHPQRARSKTLFYPISIMLQIFTPNILSYLSKLKIQKLTSSCPHPQMFSLCLDAPKGPSYNSKNIML